VLVAFIFLSITQRVETLGAKGAKHLPPTRVGQGTLVGFDNGGSIEPIQRHGVGRMENGCMRRKAEVMVERKKEGMEKRSGQVESG